MFNKPVASQVIGLELDAFMMRGVVLHFVKKKPYVKELFEFPISPAEKGFSDSAEQNNKLQQLVNHNLITTTLNTSDLLIRPLDLKLQKKKDIDAVFQFQAEPLLPYPIENAILDKLVIFQDKETTKLTILSARKDHIENHIKLWNEWNINPEVISGEPHALSIFAHHLLMQPESYYVLHLGLKQVLCVLVENGNLISSQALPKGIDDLLVAYSQPTTDAFTAYQNLKSLDIDESSMTESLELLRLSITRAIYALTRQYKGRNLNSIFITGPGANIPKLVEHIAKSIDKTLIRLPEKSKLKMSNEDLNTYAISLGTALSLLPLKYSSINFRQGDLAYPAPWKRIKRPLLIYLGLCLALAIALTLYGQSYISYQDSQNKAAYLSLLDVMNKPYDDFEKTVSNKNSLYSNTIVPIDHLTTQDMMSRLQYLEKEIQSTPFTYPLQPNTPLVSDVLAWISSHPHFTINATNTKSLEIESFSYAFVKRPEPSKKQEKYQVKIELEFSSPSPKMAREFHDALIAPNYMVDPKAEIKWNSVDGKYRTSFFLKDKTFYPTI